MWKILGVDVSWWQGVIDWIKLKSKAAFVFIRAGSVNSVTGEMYWDWALSVNGPAAENVKIEKGFYWFYREFGKAHAIRQAEFFWGLVSEYTIERGLVIDVEVINFNPWNVLAFLDRLQELSGLPDDKLGVYTRGWLWTSRGGGNVPPLKRFFLWIARYINGLEGPWSDSERYRAYPWDYADYWQQSADGNNRGDEFGVESDDIDINLQRLASVGGGDTPVDPQNPAEVPLGAVETMWAYGVGQGWWA